MPIAPERLRTEALQLSDEARAELAVDLLASLVPPDLRSEGEWIAEVERRARAALGGEPGVSWDEARRQVEERLHR